MARYCWVLAPQRWLGYGCSLVFLLDLTKMLLYIELCLVWTCNWGRLGSVFAFFIKVLSKELFVIFLIPIIAPNSFNFFTAPIFLLFSWHWVLIKNRPFQILWLRYIKAHLSFFIFLIIANKVSLGWSFAFLAFFKLTFLHLVLYMLLHLFFFLWCPIGLYILPLFKLWVLLFRLLNIINDHLSFFTNLRSLKHVLVDVVW
jgi:hypothetical protein